jgi:hypothetical protein
MKKRILQLIFALPLVLLSCEKGSFPSQENENRDSHLAGLNNPTSTQLKSGQDTSTQTQIMDFMTKMQLVHEDPDYEGNELWNYGADSAIWYLEASLNMYFRYYYRYCSPNDRKYKSYIDSLKTDIAPGDEGYHIMELYEKFALVSDSIVALYTGIEEEDKFFLLVDISEIENDSIVAYFVCASPYDVPQSLDPYFWGFDRGKCAGGDIGRDAADNIADIANEPYPPYPSTTSSCHYFEQVSETYWISPASADGNLWEYDYSGTLLVDPCIDGSEQYDYAGYLSDLADDFHPGGSVSPIHYYIMDIMAIKNGGPPNYINDYSFYHNGKVVYGITKYCTKPPPIP